MALMESVAGGVTCRLNSHNLVGRGGGAALRIEQSCVSREHAIIAYTHGEWRVKDLGSRNGTAVNGTRVRSGTWRPVAVGDVVTFGDAAEAWRLVDAGPAVAWADTRRGGLVLADDGLLALPSPDAPRVIVYETRPGRWVAEDARDEHPVVSGDAIVIDDVVWRLHLPAAGAGRVGLAGGGRIEDVTLRVREGAGGVATVEIGTAHERTGVAPGAVAELLVALARRRLDDRVRAVRTVDEEGWVQQDELAEALGCGVSSMNALIVRATRLVRGLGVKGAARLVERRRATQELRLGVSAVELES